MKNEIMKNFLQAVEFPKLLDNLAGDCQTPAGKIYLRTLGPVEDLVLIESRLSKTQELEKHLIKNGAPRVPDAQYFEEAFENARTKGETFSGGELAALVKFLLDVIRLRQYLSPDSGIPPVLQDWLNRLHALAPLKEALQSKVSDRGEVLDSASPELKSLRDSLRSLRAEVQSFYQSFIQKTEPETLQEKIVTEREGRLVVPVKRDHQSQVPGFVHGMSASGSTLFIEPREIVESNNRVKEALLRQDEEVRKVLREATQEVLKSGKEIEETIIACAEIDAHGTLASFASRFDGQFLKPGGSTLKLVDARHPLLALESNDKFRERVIPLNVEFANGVQVILVSGPNAGGKTVALKTLGLTCVMAQAGLPVLTKNDSLIPALQHFDSDLLDGQSLKEHLSTYAAKLKALKRMMDHCSPGCLFLLDE
ncbi:MAG TPA: hypothetical protein VIJ93_03365, partial [bacterium]